MKKFFAIYLLAFLFPLGSSLRADVTIDLQVGPILSSARGFLVADVDGNGFSPPGPWGIGTTLEPGQSVGDSDDVIIAVFGTSDALPWPTGTGFGQVIAGLDLSASGIAEGTGLQLYWIEGAVDGPFQIPGGTTVFSTTNSSFVVPSDGATGKLVALSAALGGSLGAGDIESGSVGNTPIQLSLNTPTSTVIGAGETSYFEFTAVSGRGIVLDLNGNESVSGEIFDTMGNFVSDLSGANETLESGLYFLALTETTGTSSAAVDFQLLSSGYQPDLWLGGSRSRAKRNNVYSNSPAGQRYTIRMKKRLSYVLVLENDSFLSDSLKLNTTRIRLPFRETILDRGGLGNVTSATVLGTYATGALQGRTARNLSVKIRVKRSRNSRRAYRARQNFYGVSVADSTKRDAIGVLTISK